jgi:hypothetical protein
VDDAVRALGWLDITVNNAAPQVSQESMFVTLAAAAARYSRGPVFAATAGRGGR